MKTKTFFTAGLITSLFIVALCCSTGLAKIVYVDANATGGNNGSDWVNAYNYLQDALAAVTSGTEIRVAQGVYKPDEGGGNTKGDRSATFQLKNSVAIKGGYAGSGGSDPNDKNIDLYNTILSGDLDGDDKTVAVLSELGWDSTRNENSYTVVTGSGTNSSAVLDGCTVTGGNGYTFRSGGGMNNETGSPTVKDCSFVMNSAYRGGGMCNKYDSKPNVSDCYFAGNYSTWGGGMLNIEAEPQVDDCQFEGNGAIEGAGIANLNRSDPEIKDSIFANNIAELYGAGIQNDNDCSPRIELCTFILNYADQSGGAINCDNESTPEIIKCTFLRNSAFYGAAICCSNTSEPTIINCIFNGNVGLEDAGGIGNYSGSYSKLYNCLFSGNTARFGGVVYNASSTITLINCTLAGNTTTSGNGKAFSCRATNGPGEVNVSNSIVWDGGHEIETWSDGGTSFFITYTNIQAWVPSSGTINLDPFFVRYPNDGGDGWGDDPATLDVDESENDDFGDLHLLEISPCINTGNNMAVPYWLDVDLDGGPRIIGQTVDRGVYEFEKPGPEPPQHAPNADAGDDQTVYAGVDEVAQVTLDGSESSDPDGDDLTYKWTWTVDEEDFEATGVTPKIELPVGEHTIQLIVNDGTYDSGPDFVTITVVGPIKTFLSVYPQPIVRSSSEVNYIYTLLNLDDIPPEDVDDTYPILLYPGAAEPAALYINPDANGDGTTIFAIYNKQDLLDAVPEDGKYDLKVVGRLYTGQYFYGFYPVRIIE